MRSVIQIADHAMAQRVSTVLVAHKAKYSTILLVSVAVPVDRFLRNSMVFISVKRVILSVNLVMVSLQITVAYVRARFILSVECALYSVRPIIPLRNKQDLVIHVEENVNHQLLTGIAQCSIQMIVHSNLCS